MVKTRCAKCGQTMDRSELRRHWQNAHTPRYTKCPECGKKVKLKGLKGHMDNEHPKSARKTEKKPMTRKELRALFRPDYDEPKDFLDQPNVVSGGGFGVGKGKKK